MGSFIKSNCVLVFVTGEGDLLTGGDLYAVSCVLFSEAPVYYFFGIQIHYAVYNSFFFGMCNCRL